MLCLSQKHRGVIHCWLRCLLASLELGWFFYDPLWDVSKAGSRKLEINSFAAIDSHAVVSIWCESVVLVWVHCLSRGQQEIHSLWQQHSFAEMLHCLLLKICLWELCGILSTTLCIYFWKILFLNNDQLLFLDSDFLTFNLWLQRWLKFWMAVVAEIIGNCLLLLANYYIPYLV